MAMLAVWSPGGFEFGDQLRCRDQMLAHVVSQRHDARPIAFQLIRLACARQSHEVVDVGAHRRQVVA
jgi:phosphoribosylformylglycinamidine (FGAM) synthase-like amidotransferase family enzyme